MLNCRLVTILSNEDDQKEIFLQEEAVYKPVATFILALTPSEFYKIPADTTLLFTNLKPHNKRETAIHTNVTI